MASQAGAAEEGEAQAQVAGGGVDVHTDTLV